ncbi:GNAT family N-acetyltransferase [Halegenticoccus tardaugens]|uniref:GNAT family N-acetyltransferase n=1 Tax=Halegenticoccus tardaugens TaxID=2071624 RepID=UPI00100A670C|nr:GNAT family N-acetyltransferase [Halegenticoccus tardaugens]
MEFALVGWQEDEPTLKLDYRRFSYAGKFVMSTTGKAVIRRSDDRSGGDSADDDPAGDAPISCDGAVDASRASAVPDPAEFDDGVLAAAAFNEDRTDPGVLWLRYVTVRADRRGEGLGARLAAFVADRAAERGYRRLRIAVNNPFSYQALYKAGFAYTGRRTGLAELVLERPGERDRPTYQCGFDVFRDRDLGGVERDFLDAKEGADPPDLVEVPDGGNANAARRPDSGA